MEAYGSPVLPGNNRCEGRRQATLLNLLMNFTNLKMPEIKVYDAQGKQVTEI